MPPLVRLTSYIGRQPQKEALQHWSAVVATEAYCRAIYFEAAGGLGKTRLLEDFPATIQLTTPQLRVARIIDLYDFTNRNPDAIERRLIAGLKQDYPDQWYALPADEVDRYFTAYESVATAYERARLAADQSQSERLRSDLRQTFVTCWNRLAEVYPLAMRFDTLETLFSKPAPPEALVSFAQGISGTTLVLEWMNTVFVQLKHTLVLLSGRPLNRAGHPIVDQLRLHGVLADVQTLQPLLELDEMRSYLEAYGLAVDADQLDRVRAITEGRPLLLTCYAEMHRPDWAIPPSLPVDAPLHSRSDLENQIIDTILNPMDRPSRAERTLVYVLFFLAYARRGIRRSEIRALFTQLGFSERDDEVIDRLHELALIKTARSWRVGAVEVPSFDSADESDTLLFLHDEIYQLIDESDLAYALGLREPTLEYLCLLSRRSVHQSGNWIDLLRAMADHLYYELTRDIGGSGYQTYVVYMDWLLRDRENEAALILADVFWATLTTRVARGGREIQPYRDALEQTDLRYADILRDEQVRQIKLVRARDQNRAAFDLAERVYAQFVHESILPAEQQVSAGHLPASHQYLFVDLNVTRAATAMQAQASSDEAQPEELFTQVITLLEQPEQISDSLLEQRRNYFLGLAYTLRSQLRRQQQRFVDSMHDAEQGRIAFKRYRGDSGRDAAPADLLNDHIETDVAQAINNLAYNLALSGNLRRAIRLSNEVLERYSDAISDYRKALILNTNALIRIRLGEYLEAQAVLRQAEHAAHESGSQRARGLVTHARAQLEREMMVARQDPDPHVDEVFDEAARLLRSEPGWLTEVYYDWAQYDRSLAAIYSQNGADAAAQQYNQRALDHLDQALDLLPPTPSMQRTSLLQAKAGVYNNLGAYAQASAALDEADNLMTVPMPEYGQVVAGRIALQRAYVALYWQSDPEAALLAMAVALTRAYIFARQHRDQKTFERLIERLIRDIPAAALEAFEAATSSGELQVVVEDLPYQRPDPQRWLHEWGYSIRYINECIATQLDL